jgi:hydroxyacylglutathione hydrolase
MIANDDTLRIERIETAPFGTNAYILFCAQTGQSAVIDAPGDAARITGKLTGTEPRYLLLTHSHRDHTGVLAALRESLGVPFLAHPADAGGFPATPDRLLENGEILPLGNLEIEVIHTPGHTPGSVCFRCGGYLFAGDTVFPGGPGKTASPEAFRQITAAITEKILVLPKEVRVLPGHGEATTVGEVSGEYTVFAAREHAPDLCGDVLWLSG